MSKKRARPMHLSTLDEVRELTKTEDVIFVDPGSDGTGWAVFPFSDEEFRTPLAHGVLTSRKKTWHARFTDIVLEFESTVIPYCADRMVLEWPELWSGSAKSQAAAVSGDLLKLAALCGALESAAIGNRWQQPSLFISPNEWKGNLPKAAVNARIKRAISRKYPNHASDAVGMGLAVMGLL